MTGVWIIIDAIMIYLNFIWAKKESQEGGSRFFKHAFTIFLAFWILAFGFDLVSLISIIFGG